MIIDIIVVAVFALNLFFGFRRGFSKTVLRLFGFFAAFVIVSVAGASFEQAALKTDAGKFVKSKVYNITYERLYSAAEKGKENLSESVKLPEFIAGEIEQKYNEDSTEACNSISSAVSEKVFSIGSKIFLFVSLLVLFAVAGFIVPKIFKLPVLKQADKLLGLGIGAVNGFLFAYLLLFIIAIILSVSDIEWLKDAVNGSALYRQIYENGFITSVFR